MQRSAGSGHVRFLQCTSIGSVSRKEGVTSRVVRSKLIASYAWKMHAYNQMRERKQLTATCMNQLVTFCTMHEHSQHVFPLNSMLPPLSAIPGIMAPPQSSRKRAIILCKGDVTVQGRGKIARQLHINTQKNRLGLRQEDQTQINGIICANTKHWLSGGATRNLEPPIPSCSVAISYHSHFAHVYS